MPEYTDSVRQTARELVERIKTDPAFKAQVEQNPETTLVAAGLPEEVIPNFLHETQLGGEVDGYEGCTVSCIGSGCLITVL